MTEIALSETDIRIGQERIRLEQPMPAPPVITLDLMKRLSELEQENISLSARIGLLEIRVAELGIPWHRRAWEWLKSAWRK